MTDRDMLLEFVEWFGGGVAGEPPILPEDIDAFLASREPLHNLQQLVSTDGETAGKSEKPACPENYTGTGCRPEDVMGLPMPAPHVTVTEFAGSEIPEHAGPAPFEKITEVEGRAWVATAKSHFDPPTGCGGGITVLWELLPSRALSPDKLGHGPDGRFRITVEFWPSK